MACSFVRNCSALCVLLFSEIKDGRIPRTDNSQFYTWAGNVAEMKASPDGDF